MLMRGVRSVTSQYSSDAASACLDDSTNLEMLGDTDTILGQRRDSCHRICTNIVLMLTQRWR